ncbi:MAG: hypothetical protein JWL64_1593 [Frankiales bacterium]|nr:hypothetical protein [Frankiales bacterium]
MTSRIPESPSASEAEGIPDLEDHTAPGEVGSEPPQETAIAVDDFGTTAAEQREGESLTGRLDRELPDLAVTDVAPVEDERAGQGIGRIVEPDEGVRGDTEAEAFAEDVGTDVGGYSAEESAMHLDPES